MAHRSLYLALERGQVSRIAEGVQKGEAKQR